MGDAVQRFVRKVRRLPGGCWEWTGQPAWNGYGRFGLDGREIMAHRFAYEAVRGPVPTGLQLDHLCRNRICVRPSHLEAVTQKVNLQRGIGPALASQRQLAKTHCPHGHPYTPENILRVHGNERRCRECQRAWNKIASDRRKAGR